MFLLVAYMVRARGFRPAEARIRYLTSRQDLVVENTGEGATLLKRDASSIPALSRFLNTSGYAERWAEDLERADARLRPGEYFMVRVALAIVAGAVVAIMGRSAVALALALPVGAMAYMMPAYWLRFRVQRRTHKINGQLVETIALLSNSLRAGFAFGQAVDVASKRMGPPISVELNRMLLDINLGSTAEDALLSMNRRVNSDDLDMVVTAILIQRSTGGNLAEVLESVTETIRERERIQGEIKTFTASQRLTGWILSLWPAGLALLFYALAPGVTSLLWKTSIGLVLLGIWVMLNTLGIVTIRRILDIDI